MFDLGYFRGIESEIFNIMFLNQPSSLNKRSGIVTGFKYFESSEI